MTKRIYLESRMVIVAGVPTGSGHLYLVFRDQGAAPRDFDDTALGAIADEVIMGTSASLGTLLKVFAGVPIGGTDDGYNGATAQSRFSLDITDRATSTRMASPMQVSCR